jgi:hypothetical protein
MAKSSAFSGGFNEATVRDALFNTMLMGMPERTDQRLTWYWKRDQTYVPDDPAGNPYDWTAAPVTDNPGNPALPDAGEDQSLQVPYALEFSARPAGSSTTVLGEIDTSRAEITLLDTDFEKIRTADYAVIDNSRYRIQFSSPPIGLFGLTVHTVYLEAEDET